jgi:hypothetical protein
LTAKTTEAYLGFKFTSFLGVLDRKLTFVFRSSRSQEDFMRNLLALKPPVYIQIICLLSFFSLSHSANALRLDPTLHGLCGESCVNGGWPIPNQNAFNGLARSYGLALAPLDLSPANTIGINAVETEFSFAFSSLTDDSSSWVSAVNTTTPPTQLNTTRFTLRKGLPYSFELQGQLGYLLDSELWTLGAGVKWALNEAVRSFPIDLSLHAHANRLAGSTQLDLSTVSYGASLGTQFGILGMVNIAPFVSYRPMMIFAGSTTLDATPGKFDAPGTGMDSGSTAFVFSRTEETINRASAGLRFLFGVLRLTGEFMWTPHQTNINVSLGLYL